MTKQYIAHDGLNIYGTGKSLMAATSDAGQNCPDFRGVLEVQRCTEALALQLENEGGAITWEETDGTACTEAEYALDQAAPLMDDAIREGIHSNFAAASDAAEFLAEYERRHEAQFGSDFTY
jgi:hypothetical protein